MSGRPPCELVLETWTEAWLLEKRLRWTGLRELSALRDAGAHSDCKGGVMSWSDMLRPVGQEVQDPRTEMVFIPNTCILLTTDGVES